MSHAITEAIVLHQTASMNFLAAAQRLLPQSACIQHKLKLNDQHNARALTKWQHRFGAVMGKYTLESALQSRGMLNTTCSKCTVRLTTASAPQPTLYIRVLTYMYMLPNHSNLSPSRLDSGVAHVTSLINVDLTQISVACGSYKVGHMKAVNLT